MNTDKNLVKYLQQIEKSYNNLQQNYSYAVAEDVEKAFEAYITYDPDITIILSFAIFLYYPPLADWNKSLEYLKKILHRDPSYANALLMIGFLKTTTCIEKVEPELLAKLSSISHDSEMQAMAELIIAWYYQLAHNEQQYEAHLRKSIQLCPYYARSLEYLAELYWGQGKFAEAQQIAKHALQNIKVVNNLNHDQTIHDIVPDFFDYYLKGICVTSVTIDFLEKMICYKI